MGQLRAAAGGAVNTRDEHAGAGAAAPAAPAPSRVVATWAGDHQFDTGRPGGPTARIDSDTVTGQSPVDALLSALATCTAVDVVDILRKRRTPVSALRVAEAETFQLVVSDIGMPGMDGLQLIAELRRRERSARWPAIAISGFGQASDAERAKAAGFDGHLAKPLSIEALHRTFERLVQR